MKMNHEMTEAFTDLLARNFVELRYEIPLEDLVEISFIINKTINRLGEKYNQP